MPSYRSIGYGGGGQKLRTFQMTPLSPNCSRKFKTGSVVVARPFVARHRSTSTCLRCYALTVSISPSSAAWQTKSGNSSGDEADDSEDDSPSESEDALDAPRLSPGNDATWAIVEL